MYMEVMLVNKQELKELIDSSINDALSKIQENQTKNEIHPASLIYGIKGLASFLGVTQPTAQKWKNDGVFPFIQRGRTIIFKSEEVLAGLSKKKSRF